MSNHINSIAKAEAFLSYLNTITLLSVLVEKCLGRTELGFSVFIYFDSKCNRFLQKTSLKLGFRFSLIEAWWWWLRWCAVCVCYLG